MLLLFLALFCIFFSFILHHCSLPRKLSPHTAGGAMTTERESHEHTLSPRPAKAELSPTVIYLVRLVEQLAEAILLD